MLPPLKQIVALANFHKKTISALKKELFLFFCSKHLNQFWLLRQLKGLMNRRDSMEDLRLRVEALSRNSFQDSWRRIQPDIVLPSLGAACCRAVVAWRLRPCSLLACLLSLPVSACVRSLCSRAASRGERTVPLQANRSCSRRVSCLGVNKNKKFAGMKSSHAQSTFPKQKNQKTATFIFFCFKASTKF